MVGDAVTGRVGESPWRRSPSGLWLALRDRLGGCLTTLRQISGMPDYEAYVAWVRFLGEDERHPAPPERKRLAERERTVAETALRGRRVWPRGQCAIGLLCEAAGDASGARAYLTEALRADERLGVARQALARMRG